MGKAVQRENGNDLPNDLDKNRSGRRADAASWLSVINPASEDCKMKK